MRIKSLTISIPAGNYIARIERAEEKTSRSGNSQLVEVALRIAGPTCAGMAVYDHLIIAGKSSGAVFYGVRRLRSLLVALGFDPDDEFEPENLVGKVVEVTIKSGKDDPIWGPQVEVVAYGAVDEEDLEVVADEAFTDFIIPV